MKSPAAILSIFILVFITAAFALAKGGQDQIPAEDKIKIEYLKKLMIEAKQAPEPWTYQVVDIPSKTSASNLETKLDNLGLKHQELVAITPLQNGNSRYVFKSRAR